MEHILLEFYNKYCKKDNWLPYIQKGGNNIHIPIFLKEDEKCQGDDYYLDVFIYLDDNTFIVNTDGYEINIEQYFKIMHDIEELIKKIKGRNK